MKNILVPVDFSQPSIEAFKFAINLITKSKGSITVLHAIDLPMVVYGSSLDMPIYTYDVTVRKNLTKNAQDRFQKLIRQYGRSNKKISLKVEEGSVFSVIRTYSEKRKFDLIVMGTQGATGLREFFIGSNTEKVVRFSRIPVLAIRKSVPVSSIRNIVYPCSLETGQAGFIKKLKALQHYFQARLHVLYLNTPLNFVRDGELNAFVRKNKLTKCTTYIRSDRYEANGINSFVNEIKADMLVMPTHGRKGFAHWFYGSVTEDIVNHIQCPIWTYAMK